MEDPKHAKIQVTEIFASLQGESSWAGFPCVFIRLTGCPLRCTWCDTHNAFEGGEEWTVGDIVRKAQTFGLPLVEVTGGEPLAQDACISLLEELLKSGFRVLLETSGSMDIGPVPEDVIRIVDVKCPGSGEENRNFWDNLQRLRPLDEVKFVIRDAVDYDYARDVIDRFGLEGRNGILLSPVRGELEPAQLSEWMLRDHLRARLNLQLHKIIWGPNVQGR
jgi:7-carboxy-7-deazaguanine synthase